MCVMRCSCDGGRHEEVSHFEGSMTSPLQLSIDDAMVHQGGSCGLDELSQPTSQAARSMQPPLLCTAHTPSVPCRRRPAVYAGCIALSELYPGNARHDCLTGKDTKAGHQAGLGYT